MNKPPGWKRLVVCCDGTWNAPEINNPKKNHPTNVLKLTRAIRPVDRSGVVQVVEYVPGIGTHDIIDRYLGGATGWGISSNIQSAYQFIVNNYRHQDDLYLFGFSRGAYTVRSLSGFISELGLIRKEEMHVFPEAYREYRKPPDQRSKKFGEDFGEIKDPEYSEVPIYFLGVWDTVGALGAPTPLLYRLTRYLFSFHNTKLAPKVKYAYQALALHEVRTHFKPVLWTEKAQGQVVEQVWFSGAHSDVGGGLDQHGLADSALLWMKDKAQRTGLEFNDSYLNQIVAPDPLEAVSISRRKVYRLSRPFVRPIGPSYTDEIKPRSLQEYKHPSVDERLEKLHDEEKLGYGKDRSFREVDERSRKLDSCEDAKTAELKKQEEEAKEEVERLAEAVGVGGGQQGGSAIGETPTNITLPGTVLKKVIR